MAEKKALEAYLFWLLCGIGIFEAGHLAGVFGKLSISDCGKVITVLFVAAVVLVLAGIFMVFRNTRRKGPKGAAVGGKEKGRSSRIGLPLAVFVVLFAVQIYGIIREPIFTTAGDIMQETVNSFLVTDRIYAVSPLTGREFTGVPMRYEILCLPTIYTLLCRWLDVAPEVMLGRVIPLVVFSTAYAAYYLLGSSLFGRERKDADKRLWFIVFVAFVFSFCEKMPYMEGYGLLHGGYLGTTIRSSILVPLVFYAMLERKWIFTVLCVLAEACIVWTFWGFGVCAAVAAGMLVIEKVYRNGVFRACLDRLEKFHRGI